MENITSSIQGKKEHQGKKSKCMAKKISNRGLSFNFRIIITFVTFAKEKSALLRSALERSAPKSQDKVAQNPYKTHLDNPKKPELDPNTNTEIS